ncbi:hypothetical protein AMTRI_Chr03g142870 [Amborella trichopoda]
MGFTPIEKQSILTNLSTVDAQRILLRSQSNPSMALNFFNCIRTDPGPKPTVELMIEVIKTHECQVLENLVQSMDECNLNSVVLDMLVKQSDRLIVVGLVPTINACKSLLNGLLRSNAINTCWEMVESGLVPDFMICLVCGYCKSRELDKAEWVLCYFSGIFQMPSVESYNEIIGAHIKNRDMLKLGLVPNCQTCKLLITGLSSRKGNQTKLIMFTHACMFKSCI